MTKLLVELSEPDDVRIAYRSRAEIVMMTGSLQKCKEYRALLDAYTDYEPHIWFAIESGAAVPADTLSSLKVEKLILSASRSEILPLVMAVDCQLRSFKLVIAITTSNIPDSSLMKSAAALGVCGFLLRGSQTNLHILSQLEVADIGQFIQDTHDAGIAGGIMGNMEAPDIPRLLPFSPDWLGFSVEHPITHGHFGDDTTTSLIRALLPFDTDLNFNSLGDALGTDRIIVEDFILPIEIGAYKHEYGRKQNVRFNIAAEVARLSANPEDMRHIFSYDLILDGIRNLVALGHVELVETLAERIAAFILAYPRVRKVVVRVDKLDLGPLAIGVEIERTKKPVIGTAL